MRPTPEEITHTIAERLRDPENPSLTDQFTHEELLVALVDEFGWIKLSPEECLVECEHRSVLGDDPTRFCLQQRVARADQETKSRFHCVETLVVIEDGQPRRATQAEYCPVADAVTALKDRES